MVRKEILSFTNILQLVICLLVLIFLAIPKTAPTPRVTNEYNPRFTMRLQLPEGWQTFPVRDDFMVIQKSRRDNKPNTTIVVYDQRCEEDDCVANVVPSYDEVRKELEGNPGFRMNSVLVYSEKGKSYTWFSFRMPKELTTSSVFRNIFLPEDFPERPLLTFVNIQQGSTLVSAIIMSEMHNKVALFEAEQMLGKVEILSSNWLD